MNISAEAWSAVAGISSVVVAIVSTIISAHNIRASREIANTARQHSDHVSRRDTFQRIHESLVAPAAAGGRKKLLIAFKRRHSGIRKFLGFNLRAFPHVKSRAWDEINYSLALFDTLGGYYVRGEVNRADVDDAWHGPLSRLHDAYEDLILHRKARGINDRWRSLDALMCNSARVDCQACQQSARPLL